MRKQYVGLTGIPAAMPYHDWIWYSLHINHHQGPEHWGGELNAVTALLNQPQFTLVVGPTPPTFPQPV